MLKLYYTLEHHQRISTHPVVILFLVYVTPKWRVRYLTFATLYIFASHVQMTAQGISILMQVWCRRTVISLNCSKPYLINTNCIFAWVYVVNVADASQEITDAASKSESIACIGDFCIAGMKISLCVALVRQFIASFKVARLKEKGAEFSELRLSLRKIIPNNIVGKFIEPTFVSFQRLVRDCPVTDKRIGQPTLYENLGLYHHKPSLDYNVEISLHKPD